jgi:hypothetical protein
VYRGREKEREGKREKKLGKKLIRKRRKNTQGWGVLSRGLVPGFPFKF